METVLDYQRQLLQRKALFIIVITDHFRAAAGLRRSLSEAAPLVSLSLRPSSEHLLRLLVWERTAAAHVRAPLSVVVPRNQVRPAAMEMTKHSSPASALSRATLSFDFKNGLQPPPPLLLAELERRGGPSATATWARAQERLKEGIQGFYGDECGFLFVLSVIGLPWFCLAQTKRNSFLRGWLADLNSVLEPAGFYAKFQRVLARDENSKDEIWLAVAMTADDAGVLRREPIFWRHGHCGPGRFPADCACCCCCCCEPKVV
jgi:hypothetical protein